MKNLKTIINNLMQIIGFPMTAFIFYSVHSGQFFHFVMGCFGFVLFMTGLLREVE